MAGKRKGVVLVDLLSWQEPIEGTNPPRFSHLRATRGDLVELGSEAADRAFENGWVAAPADAAKALDDTSPDVMYGPVPPGEDGDKQLSEAKAEWLIAYVGQNPTEAERVNRVELAGKKRATVLKGSDVDPAGDGATGSAGV